MIAGAPLSISVKRVYRRPRRSDGLRVLVDRLWPRGLTKASARLDFWMQDLAPSDALRKWFDHREERWCAFRERYLMEVDENREQALDLLRLCAKGPVTLLFSSRELEHNNAVVLRDWLLRHVSEIDELAV